MLKKYASEQFWKLYEKLPQELKDVLWAEETGNNIYDVCQRYEIEENLEDVVDLVGQVLVGVLPPEDFQATLEKELKLEKETAKKAGQEINRFIFYPVRTDLEKLYKTEIAVSVKSIEVEQEEQPTAPKTSPEKDSYREPLE